MGSSGGVKRSLVGDDPCHKCPYNDGRKKIPPTLPSAPKLMVVGMSPVGPEEEEGKHHVGEAGQLVRESLKAAGLDPVADVGYLNLTRCRPNQDNFDDPAWAKAVKCCSRFLNRDLSGQTPVLALGTRVLQVLSGDSKARISGYHGLWVATQKHFRLFAAHYPAGFFRIPNDEQRVALLEEFAAEMQTLVKGLESASAPTREVPIFRTPEEAERTLTWLASFPHPWAFDIESFDAVEFPSRKNVSTDPCHPDFRMHGIAIAVSSTKGFYLYLKDYHENKKVWTRVLAPAFGSPAEKWAFSGHFDEEGVVYPGWVPKVVNRRGDGMLALVTLGNGFNESLRLERATVDILKRPQYWSGLDKSKMRDHPVDQVAAGAVEDAMNTYALCQALHHRMKRRQYL